MGINVQIFNTAGDHTWTKPSGAKLVDLFMLGGGEGGDNGGAFGAGAGDGGSAANCGLLVRVLADDLGATETVTVGAGGAGQPAGVAPSGAQNPGDHSRFAEFYVRGYGETGTYENYGGNLNFSGGTFRLGDGAPGGAATSAGDPGNNTGLDTSQPDYYFSCAGGTGGAADANGGDGTDSPFSMIDFMFMSDNSMPRRIMAFGSGGGGGGGEDSVAPGAGGDGGWPGGGGGGGGEAADAGSANGGAGGDGSHGVVVVITYTSST